MILHQTAAEQFDNLCRVYDRLVNQEVHRHDLDHFFKVASHLAEITEKDPSTTQQRKSSATALRTDPEFELCREIANAQKHFTLNPKQHPNPTISRAEVSSGYGVGQFGMGGFGVGEESVELVFNNGCTGDALDLVQSLFKKWARVYGHTIV